MLTTDVPASELVALIGELGRIDYGDDEDDVQPTARAKEAQQIMHYLIERGWRPPAQQKARMWIILKPTEIAEDDVFEFPGGPTAHYMIQDFPEVLWNRAPVVGDVIPLCGTGAEVDSVDLYLDGSTLVWAHTDSFASYTAELLKLGFRPSSSEEVDHLP